MGGVLGQRSAQGAQLGQRGWACARSALLTATTEGLGYCLFWATFALGADLSFDDVVRNSLR